MLASDRPPSAEEPSLAARPAGGSDGDAAACPGRSLIALGPRRHDAEAGLVTRASAPFLAQLIAAAQQLPQLRRRRRVEPQDGAASYAPPVVPRLGRSLSRSI